MPRVIVSSGHTTQNPGTVANSLREVDLARKISKKVLPHLRQNGVITLSVPPELDLLKRLEWINKTGYDAASNDIAIEIHINDGGKSGFEGWYEGKGGNNSQKLTEIVLNHVTAETKLTNQGAKSEFEHSLGSIAFLHEGHPVTSLIECCYLDNDDDVEFLKDEKNLDIIGKGIAKGILAYLGLQYREIIVPPQQPVQAAPPVAAQPAPQNNDQQMNPATTPSSIQAGPLQQADNVNNQDDKSSQGTSNSNMMTPQMSPPMDDLDFDDGFDDFSNPMGTPPPMNNNWGAPPPPAAGGGFGGGIQPMPTREERKELITNNYVKILGREPNQNDLNYFLNIGIKEDELIKKMVDSQEHSDLVKSRQEVIEIKQKLADQQAELDHLRAAAGDNRNIIGNLQQSIQQKNYTLAQMHHKLNAITYNQKTAALNTPTHSMKEHNYKGTFLDKLFKAFSDLFD